MAARGLRPLRPGVYVPALCFFHPDTEEIDSDTLCRHVVRLAKAGVLGIAPHGSNGEAVHQTRKERQIVTTATRKALDEAGFGHVVVIAGCSSESTHETVEMCVEAHGSGADYALILSPSYYANLFAPNLQTVVEYFTAVADRSPIPVILYNYPAVTGGIDLSSDHIIALAAHPNIAGVKLTCGNTGKLNRIAAATRARAGTHYNPSAPDFLVLGGSADFTVQALVAGAHGMLVGLGNITPKVCVRLFDLFAAYLREGGSGLQQARDMQEIVSRGDWAVIRNGAVGTKAALQSLCGYGGICRHPLPKPSVEEVKMWADKLSEIWQLEESLK